MAERVQIFAITFFKQVIPSCSESLFHMQTRRLDSNLQVKCLQEYQRNLENGPGSFFNPHPPNLTKESPDDETGSTGEPVKHLTLPLGLGPQKNR